MTVRQQCSSKDVAARDLTSGYQWDAKAVYTPHEAQAAGKGSPTVAWQGLELGRERVGKEMWSMNKGKSMEDFKLE